MLDKKKLHNGKEYLYYNEDSQIGMLCRYSTNHANPYILVLMGNFKSFRTFNGFEKAVEYLIEKYNLSGGILETF